MNRASQLDTDERARSSGESGAEERVRGIIAQWEATGHADTLEALGRFPELRLDKSAVLDLAYEEYVQRCDGGEDVDPDEFCARFPDHQSSVRRLIDAHEFLALNGSALAHAPTFEWPKAGERLDDFEILKRLGRGSFARVYLAREVVTDRTVVLKVSPHDDREPQALGQLSHANVIPIYQARRVRQGMQVIVMPYAGGSTLIDLIEEAFPGGKSGPVGNDALARAIARHRPAGDATAATSEAASIENRPYPLVVLTLARELAEGLAYLHAHGIQHRDLKPSNVLLSWQGRPLILDFNLAANVNKGLDQFGGSLDHMAPEQIRRCGGDTSGPVVDQRADLFSFGVILYQLLTGTHPFKLHSTLRPSMHKVASIDAARLLLQHQAQGCQPPRAISPSIHPDLERLVLACLQLDPERRPASAQAVADELARISRIDPRRERHRRRRRRLVAAAIVAVACVLGVQSYFVATRPSLSVRAVAAARADIDSGDFAQAAERLNAVLTPGTVNGEAYWLRGRALLGLGDYTAAVSDFERAFEQEYFAEGRTAALLAYLYARRNSYEAAFHRANEAERQGFGSPEFWNNRANSLLHQSAIDLRALEKAEEDLTRALEQNPSLGAAYYNRALLYERLANARHDPAFFDKAIEAVWQGKEHGVQSSTLFKIGADFYMHRRPLTAQDRTRALELLNLAVDCGLDPERLRKAPQFAPLADDTRFQNVLARPVVATSESVRPELVDPLGFTAK